MKGSSKKYRPHRTHKTSFFKTLLRGLGIGKKRHHKSISKSDVSQVVVLPQNKKRHKARHKHRPFYFITRLFKKRPPRISKSSLMFKQESEHQLTSVPGEDKSKEVHHAKKPVMSIRQMAVYIFNSMMLFLISYIVAYITYQLAVIIAASFFGIDSVLYYYEVFFPIGNYGALWTRYNIIMITISGPLVSLILGFVYFRLFLRRKGIGPMAKLFFWWLSFHSFSMFFGAYVAGVITVQGFGFATGWLYLPVFIKFLVALVSLFVLMAIGYYATSSLLETSNSYKRISGKNRGYFILTQALVPWLLGSLILLLIKIPDKNPQQAV